MKHYINPADGALYVVADTDTSNDREATPEELAAHELARQPTPLQKIRAAEDAAENYTRKANRIATLDSALDKAMLDPRAVGKTRAEVRAIYRQLNPTFRILDDLEIFCESERKKIV